MNSTSHHANPAADQAAALWAARLDGSVLSVNDRAALDRWLAADPVHRALLASYCQFSADLEQHLPLLEGIKVRSAEKSSAQSTARPLPWLPRPLWAGVMLTAAAAVALVLWLGRSPTQTENLATPIGQRQSLTLADGTQVELNAQTSLQVELGRSERRARLAIGQAFFTVAPDATRPFYVETPAGSVRVTGTQFDVRADTPTNLEVTVLEGSVQVRPAHGTGTAPLSLTAGTQFARGKARLLTSTELAAALAWRTGQIVFDGTSLRDALAHFARFHGRSIHATDTAADLRVGGRYSLDDLDGFLSALEEFLPVRATRDPSGAIEVRLRDEH